MLQDIQIIAQAGKTVILIAHRLSTVKNADQIVVLQKGVVVEQGTHVGLYRHKGKYYRLWQASLSDSEQ